MKATTIAMKLVEAGHYSLAMELIEIVSAPRGLKAPKDAKKDLDKYFAKCLNSPKAKGMDTKRADAYCASVAWSIFCKYKKPGHPSCKKSAEQYFPRKKAA